MKQKIGIIVENSFDRYQQLIIAGLRHQAELRGIGVHIFDCNSSDHIPGAVRYKDIMYSLVDPKGLDGLILLPGALLNTGASENIDLFLKRYDKIPMLSLSAPMAGLPSIVVDNHQGMLTMMRHLTSMRGFKRIGFIRGPEENNEAEERFAGYLSGLQEAGIEYDPDIVFPGIFEKISGQEAVRSILQLELQLDALLAADDYMALGALEALHEHGIRVPQDVALAGFDDVDLAAYTRPPLTTMRQPIFEMGERAVMLLEQMFEGRDVPPLTRMNVNLIVRESCASVAHTDTAHHDKHREISAEERKSFKSLFSFQTWIADKVGIGIDEIQQETLFAEHFRKITAQQYNESQHQNDTSVYDLFYESLESGISVSLWRTILDCCSSATMQYTGHILQELFRASADVSRHLLLLQEDTAVALRRIGDRLINTFSHNEIKELIGSACAGNSIHGIVGLFTGTDSTELRIYVQLDPKRNINTEDMCIPVSELFPGGAFEPESLNCIYIPLHKDGEAWGIAVFGLCMFEEQDFAVLTDRISRAIAGAQLMEQVSSYTEELEETVAARTSELIRANQRLLENSYTDELSTLHNRRFLRDVIEPEACRIMKAYSMNATCEGKRQSDRSGLLYGILLLDIDHFKKINDMHGHDSGDLVIQEFSSILRSSVRENDHVVRYGGEEFIIVLKDLKPNFLADIAEKIRKKVEQTPFQTVQGNTIQLSCSIGSSFFPPSEVRPDLFGFWDAITLGDLSLYYAKEHGRNQAVILEILPEFFKGQVQKIHSGEELDQAVQHGLIRLSIR